jgi:hypothetical protein
VDLDVSVRVAVLVACLAVAACIAHGNMQTPAGVAGASGATGAAGMTGAAGLATASSGRVATSGSGAAGRAPIDAGVAGAAGAAATPPRAGAPSDDDAGVSPVTDAAVSGGSASFSDSFEQSTSLDLARYEVVTKDCSGTGAAMVDASSGHTGTHSLRIQGGGGYCNHVFVRPKLLTNALPSPLYARVFVKITTALTDNHVTFAAVHDMREDKDLRLGGQKQVLIWNRESDDATLPELSPTGVMLSTALPAGAWHCVEWSINPMTRAIETWFDDKPVTGLTVDAQPTPDVDTQWLRKMDWQPQPIDLRLGWESYGNDANTLWFDDLAIGTSRLHCTP